MRRPALAGLFFLAAAGCGGEAAVPDKPTWAADVQPILQANCFHCHGPTASLTKWGTARWDVYDLTETGYAELGFAPMEDPVTHLRAFVGASDRSHFGAIPIYISPKAAEGRMPPPPATAISARDAAVLEQWQATGFTKGSHAQNHLPTITWLEGKKLFAVNDEDGDQVLGKLTCGEMEVPINFSGGQELPDGATPPCSGKLYDGFETASVDLQ